MKGFVVADRAKNVWKIIKAIADRNPDLTLKVYLKEDKYRVDLRRWGSCFNVVVDEKSDCDMEQKLDHIERIADSLEKISKQLARGLPKQ